MKTRPLAFALLVSLAPAAAFPPSVALAQAGADDPATKMARQRFQEGVTFFDKGQFEMARAAFLQAYALRKHPTVLLNLAQSSLKSAHTLEAARYFQQFLKESSGASEAQRADATRGLGEARMKLGRIDVIGASAGADVYVDDERTGVAPLDHSVDVEPGTHTVRSQGTSGEQSIQVTANVGQGVVARFNASGAAPVAPAPSAPVEPSPEAPSPAAAPESEANQAPAPRTEPTVEHGGIEQSHPWGWVIASSAVTVVGFGFAAFFGVQKTNAQNSANTVAGAIVANGGGQGTCYVTATTPTATFANACSALASDNNNVNADATIANIGIAVGVVGVAGLITSIIFTATSYGGGSASIDTPKATGANTLTVTPVLGKGLGGLGLGGSF